MADARTWSLILANDATDALSPSQGFTGIEGFELSGTWSGVVTFEAKILTNWYSVLAVPSTSTTGATTATGNGLYRVDAGGYGAVRARFSTATSGTVVVNALGNIG